jgi:hypothetical protein
MASRVVVAALIVVVVVVVITRPTSMPILLSTGAVAYIRATNGAMPESASRQKTYQDCRVRVTLQTDNDPIHSFARKEASWREALHNHGFGAPMQTQLRCVAKGALVIEW